MAKWLACSLSSLFYYWQQEPSSDHLSRKEKQGLSAKPRDITGMNVNQALVYPISMAGQMITAGAKPRACDAKDITGKSVNFLILGVIGRNKVLPPPVPVYIKKALITLKHAALQVTRLAMEIVNPPTKTGKQT